MKIAQVVGSTNPAGGILRVVVTLASAFAKAGHTTDIIYWDNKVPDHAKNVSARFVKMNLFGLSRHNILSNIIRKLGKLIWGDFSSYFYSFFLTHQMERFLAQGGYDAVFFHTPYNFGFYRLAQSHFVVVHTTLSMDLFDSVSEARRRLLQRALPRIFRDKHLIAVSKSVRDDLVKNFGADSAKATYIYNPFDFDAIVAASQSDLPPYHRPYILGAGRYVPPKNFALLIRAYAEAMCEEDLVIIGDGRRGRRDLQKLVEQLGIQDRVYFAGYQPNPYPWFRHAHLFVLSSDWEGFAMVIPEALACKTPVVSTDCPSGPREILGHCGLRDYLVPVGDAAALAGKIKEALANPPDLSDIDAKLKIFQADAVAEQYLTVINAAKEKR